MKIFIKELKDIFKSITCKKNAKPCLYLYETTSHYVTPKLHMLEVNAEHCIRTSPEKVSYVESVYLGFEVKTTDDVMHCARRTELYKISNKLIKKHFDCDSVEEFYRKICFMDFKNNDVDEEFLFCEDVSLVYSDGDFYIGIGHTELENVLNSSEEDTEPVYDLEFEED